MGYFLSASVHWFLLSRPFIGGKFQISRTAKPCLSRDINTRNIFDQAKYRAFLKKWATEESSGVRFKSKIGSYIVSMFCSVGWPCGPRAQSGGAALPSHVWTWTEAAHETRPCAHGAHGSHGPLPAAHVRLPASRSLRTTSENE